MLERIMKEVRRSRVLWRVSNGKSMLVAARLPCAQLDGHYRVQLTVTRPKSWLPGNQSDARRRDEVKSANDAVDSHESDVQEETKREQIRGERRSHAFSKD